MQYPVEINEAIFINNDGTHCGTFGPFKLRSAFQPVFAAKSKTHRLVAYEALIRPEINGSPVRIPDLFDNLKTQDQLFLERLCRSLHLRNFKILGDTSARLFLNIDPAPYTDTGLVDQEARSLITEVMNCELPTSRIICEIIETESSNNQLVEQLCTQLRSAGMHIAIDDYGSDHSNWDRYIQVRPDILKLDGEIFRNLCRTPAASAALGELVTSLDDVGCTLLVEGVETQNQLEIAINAGVPLFQGYHLAIPHIITGKYPGIPAASFIQDTTTSLPLKTTAWTSQQELVA